MPKESATTSPLSTDGRGLPSRRAGNLLSEPSLSQSCTKIKRMDYVLLLDFRVRTLEVREYREYAPLRELFEAAEAQ
jgi:hypothetical protein